MVVVVAVAIVAVIAFVKVNKLSKEIETIHTVIGLEIETQNRERENVINDVYRTLDSRLDKLESKIVSRKA